LAEHAYTYTKDLILDGMEAGQKIRVEDVVSALNTSRQPVMDAFKRLATEGFLEIIPQVGCRVVNVQPSEVSDFLTVFAAVEASVCGLAAQRRTHDELDHLAVLAHQLQLMPSGREHRTLERAFHAQIHAMAHSTISAAVAATLWDRTEFFSTLMHDESIAPRTGHEKIHAALAAGNPQGAERAMLAHILGAEAAPNRRG
jgi:DNA-binding GntR family transcriptional regulator